MTERPPYILRDLRDSDVPFVAKTWLRAYVNDHHTARARKRKYLHEQNRKLRNRLEHAYLVEHSRVVNVLLRKARTAVAVWDDDEGKRDNIWGFACAEKDPTGPTVVHFAYVKPPFRGQGIARAMLSRLFNELGTKDDRVVVSHTVDSVKSFFQRYRWPYVPVEAFIIEGGHRAA